MQQSISATRVASLVGPFDRSPAYAGLADALALLIGDGRIGTDVRLPSERDLTHALGVSRTTVTRAYAMLRDHGYAVSVQGAGTFTRVPGGRARALDRALRAREASDGVIDLNLAADRAPAGLASTYAAAMTDLPAYLGGHGYFPTGLPVLQTAIAEHYAARGLPTEPGQIVVTTGALAAATLVIRTVAELGDRVLVESPSYPNTTEAFRIRGARLATVPVDPTGWDLATITSALERVRPRLFAVTPDFQNPTGLLMSDAERDEYAAAAARTQTIPMVDETNWALDLDGQRMPRPFAAAAPETISLGSASKCFWGGLRLGWIRAPHRWIEALVRNRVRLDIGASVLEQLVLARLLADPEPVLSERRAHLVEQRAALVDALAERLPDWRFRVPTGGLSLWCELPRRSATALAAEAERHGVAVTPGPVFAVEGGLDTHLRIPFTRPPDELRAAVRRLGDAADALGTRSEPGQDRGRMIVA